MRSLSRMLILGLAIFVIGATFSAIGQFFDHEKALTLAATQVCQLPSAEMGYIEPDSQSAPVYCVNSGRIATEKDISAGIYAPACTSNPYRACYIPCYAHSASGIYHYFQVPCPLGINPAHDAAAVNQPVYNTQCPQATYQTATGQGFSRTTLNLTQGMRWYGLCADPAPSTPVASVDVSPVVAPLVAPPLAAIGVPTTLRQSASIAPTKHTAKHSKHAKKAHAKKTKKAKTTKKTKRAKKTLP